MRADPLNEIAVEQLRRVLWEREKNLEMVELLRNALRRLPRSATILVNYGYLCYWWGYYGEAMKSLEEALRIDPSNASIMGNYHYCLTAQERIAEALAVSRSAREKAPFHPEPYFYAAFDLGYRLNRYPESIAMPDRAIELEDLGFIHIVKARCLHALGRYSEAVEEYRKSLAVPPTRKASRAWLASALERLGRREEAFRECLLEIESDPGGEAAHRWVADRLRHAEGNIPGRDVDRLVSLLENEVERGSLTAIEAASLAHLHHPEHPDPGRAERILREAISRTPAEINLVSLLAEVLWEWGDGRGAVRTLEEAHRRKTGDAPIARKLENYRRRMLPCLATMGSIEAALERGPREDVVPAEAIWKSFWGCAPPTTGFEWTRPEFDDSSWGALGAPEIAALPGREGHCEMLYARKVFEVADPGRFSRMVLTVPFRDEWKVWLNGIRMESLRPDGKWLVSNTVQWYPEPGEEEVFVDSSILRPGRNVIAVLVHNMDTVKGLAVLPAIEGELPPAAPIARSIFESQSSVISLDCMAEVAYLEGCALQEDGAVVEAAGKFGEVLDIGFQVHKDAASLAAIEIVPGP
ncbi:MAG: tetratricopeptide repeat protein [Planctomycetes bacterium]|nr:tetratricopeptide repeat protein [Planctomycetota bacterium]